MMSRRWESEGVVGGFSRGAPNAVLIELVRAELARRPGLRVVDVGCGAARNAAPMAAAGCRVLGTDLALPMLAAARRRAAEDGVGGCVSLACAPMDRLPLGDGEADLVVAHGVWNLARTSDEFRHAVREGARVARPGAALFVFTFSRQTLPAQAQPVAGEPFVFTQFSGEPQCFLTASQLVEELGAAGFDPEGELQEHNRPAGRVVTATGPVIYEGTFRRRG